MDDLIGDVGVVEEAGRNVDHRWATRTRSHPHAHATSHVAAHVSTHVSTHVAAHATRGASSTTSLGPLGLTLGDQTIRVLGGQTKGNDPQFVNDPIKGSLF